MPQQSSVLIEIKVAGSPLPADVAHLLERLYVDDSLHLPDLFVLTFRDDERIVLSKAGIEIGKEISIGLSKDAQSPAVTLITGEVTGLEADFGTTGSQTIVRGFDKAHRLFRGRTTATYRNVTYSDVVRKVAGRAGLAVGTIETTSAVHPLVSQGNVSDAEFLAGLAAEVGFEVAVRQGKLDFCRPATSAAAPAAGDLAPGGDLLRLHATITAAEQVKEVQVRSWDPKKKQSIVGTAPGGTKSAKLALTAAQMAQKFGNKTHVDVNVPYASQAECDAAAKARAEQIGSAFAEVEGMSRGNPMLKAGSAVTLAMLSAPFDGTYVLTSTRHVYDPEEGYVTWFTASGRQERSLLGLASGGGSGAGTSAGDAAGLSGVVSALVTNVKDPEDQARVKVKFPWLNDDYESEWARTVHPGAGPMRGAVYLPEVNDEVLVAFEHGDLRQPYVLGGVYNGVDKPKLGPALVDGSGKVSRRGYVSRKDHQLVFFDGDGDEGIALMIGGKGQRLSMNKTKKIIKVTSDGKVEIVAQGDVAITAQGNLDVSARRITMTAKQGVAIDGGTGPVDVKTNAAASVKGTQVSVNGTASAEVKSNGVLTVQGTLVKIN